MYRKTGSLTLPDPRYPWGATFYGDRGTLRAGVMRWDYTPKRDGSPLSEEVNYEFDQYPEDRTEKDLETHVAPAIRGQMRNLSMDLGRSIQWDHAAGRAINDDEANQRLARPYRGPWVHPTPETV